MKKIGVLLAIVFLVLCVFGWISMVSDTASDAKAYKDYVKEADGWVERGLYQRAVKNYELAIEEKSTVEAYKKIDSAYKLRMEEAAELTVVDYRKFLERAIVAYPEDKQLAASYAEIFLSLGRYEEAYKGLTAVKKAGNKAKKLDDWILQARFAFKTSGNFTAIKATGGDYFTVMRNNKWNIHTFDEGYVLADEYEFIGPCNDEGITVVTGEDSRIVGADGMVYGIFEDKVTNAGILSEELIAVCCNGKFSYFNDLAEKQFGDYEAAGAFQNGLAAVKKDGKWLLVDKEGKEKSDSYDEIVLDSAGRYLFDGKIIAKDSKGYNIYDEKWKKLASIDCDEIDILTDDGLIAYGKGGKWGFVDTEGKIVIEPEFDRARSFSNGVAAVCKDGEWGFINKDGKVVIDYQFTDAMYMDDNGSCVIRADEEKNGSSPDGSEENRIEKWRFLVLRIGITED